VGECGCAAEEERKEVEWALFGVVLRADCRRRQMGFYFGLMDTLYWICVCWPTINRAYHFFYTLRPNDVLEFKIYLKKNGVLLNFTCVHVVMQQLIST
jgi:hypothetical protein